HGHPHRLTRAGFLPGPQVLSYQRARREREPRDRDEAQPLDLVPYPERRERGGPEARRETREPHVDPGEQHPCEREWRSDTEDRSEERRVGKERRRGGRRVCRTASARAASTSVHAT